MSHRGVNLPAWIIRQKNTRNESCHSWPRGFRCNFRPPFLPLPRWSILAECMENFWFCAKITGDSPLEKLEETKSVEAQLNAASLLFKRVGGCARKLNFKIKKFSNLKMKNRKLDPKSISRHAMVELEMLASRLNFGRSLSYRIHRDLLGKQRETERRMFRRTKKWNQLKKMKKKKC